MSAGPVPEHQKRLATVSIPAAAELFSVDRRTVYRWIAAGVFPQPIKIGATSRLMLEDLNRLIDRRRRKEGD